MNRISYKGVPVWTNTRGELFFFDNADPLCIGTAEGGFYPDWKERVQPRLDVFRAGLTKRLRKPEPAGKK